MEIFSSKKINNIQIKNRIVLAPMCPKFASYNGEVTDRLINYYKERAKGNVGLIITGFAYIDDYSSQVSPGQISISNERTSIGLNRLVETIHQYNCKIFIQLCHGGRQSHQSVTNNPIVAPSAVPSSGREIPKELSLEEINNLINSFANAALRAKIAGFDGVELHGAHGYLINQFISDFTNRRKDEYGGDLFSRMLFLKRIIKKIRLLVGNDYVIGCRISADEYIKKINKNSEFKGITPEVSIEVSQILEKEGIDYIHVSTGIRETYEYMTPAIYIPKGINVPTAARIKQNISIPVMVAGGISDPYFAEEIIRDGKADFISMGRALIADPFFVRKIEEGNDKKIRSCIRCNECVYRVHSGKAMKCAVNPEIGEENENAPQVILKKKTVIVIGGGPAGLQSSLLLGDASYSILLYEKLPYLGGKMIVASKPNFKKELGDFLNYLTSSVSNRKSIKVALEKDINVDYIHNHQPDILIIASGSRPFIPQIDNILKYKNNFVAEDILLNPEKISGERIVIIGGGKVGCETGIFLTNRGKKVTLIEMQGEILLDEKIRENKVILLNMLRECNIQALINKRLVSLGKDYIELVDSKNNTREIFTDYDTLVFSCGYVKNDDIYNILVQELRNFPIFKIGDVNNGTSIYDAIHQASSILKILQ